MISGVHIILNTHDATAARAFLRDFLGWACVDAGDGWLIFACPPGELACHPGPALAVGQSEGGAQLFLMCQDIEATRRELAAKGAEFEGAVTDRGYGLVTLLRVPGYGNIGLYEPHHPSPLAAFP